MRRAPALLLLACALLASVSMSGGCSGGPRVRSREVAPSVGGCPLCEDGDNDGMPDAAELRSFDDRNNFRKWFTAIAEMQFYRMADSWNPTQRDCAGLVRYAWREALRRHDRLWFQAMGEGWETVAPDVRAYQLEGGPLGEKLFRAEFGSFQAGDLEAGRFSEFADARTLKNYNVFPLGRDRRRARAGDLLFFHQPGARKYPYHVMIFLGAARIAGEGAADWVVYHTGASPAGASSADGEPEDAGEVKKVRLATLDRHPDPRWRPVERNRNFLGFYRLKILE